MDPREERGKELASKVVIKRKGDVYLVPSASSGGSYEVDLAAEEGPTCTCPDYEARRGRCKHVHAVEYTIIRESTDGDGNKVVTIARVARLTYKQPDWPAYHAAQSMEREHFADLLRGLCEGIMQPPQSTGRPRHHLADVIFSLVWKVFAGKSYRRMMGELRDWQARGYTETVVHYNTLSDYEKRDDLAPVLKALVEESALPLRAVETDFACDSSGFSTSRFARWFDEKYGRERVGREWIKCHLMVGTKTHVVTAVEVTPGTDGDAPEFPGLLATTAAGFRVEKVAADKAYLTKRNLEAVVAVGGVPYVPFKSNSSGGKGATLWNRLYHYFHMEREAFLSHYHRRSNVETAFSMIKRKFGDAIRARTFAGQTNEVLAKVLAHNICCLVLAIYELGIEPKFWQPSAAATE